MPRSLAAVSVSSTICVSSSTLASGTSILAIFALYRSTTSRRTGRMIAFSRRSTPMLFVDLLAERSAIASAECAEILHLIEALDAAVEAADLAADLPAAERVAAGDTGRTELLLLRRERVVRWNLLSGHQQADDLAHVGVLERHDLGNIGP